MRCLPNQQITQGWNELYEQWSIYTLNATEEHETAEREQRRVLLRQTLNMPAN